MSEDHEKHCCGDSSCGCSHHGECRHDEQQPEASENEPVEFPKDVPLPEPSLLTLASSITTQAMVSMGIFPHPLTGKSEFMLHQAKHLIDTVELIFEKTAGNRTDEESKTLENMLHELRMLYIAAQNEKAKRDAEPGAQPTV